jgi:hypothetical protein
LATIEEEIFTNLRTQLTADLPWLKHLETENPYVVTGDMGHHVFPLVQIFWVFDSLQEQHNAFTITKAPLIIEIVDRSDYTRTVTQYDLFQKRTDVLNSVKSILSLPGVPGFQQFSYLGRNYDIHMSPDFFVAQLQFQAWFKENYGQC